jgi:hypothetical protein
MACLISGMGWASVTRCGEPDTVGGEYGVVQTQQELPARVVVTFLCRSSRADFAVDSDKYVEITPLGPHVGDIDMEIADRIGLELLLGRLVTFDIAKPADAITLQAAMQWRTR